jgi:GT2 family glycosyltransferase
MTDALFVIIHFGASGPTITLAQNLSRMGYRVVVVANDGAPRERMCDERVAWLSSERNLGYAGALNLAAAEFAAEIYVALNNDIVIDSHAIGLCLSEFNDSEVGIVGPRLEYPDGSLQSGPGVLRGITFRPDATREMTDRSQVVQWLTGAVLFIRASVLRSVEFDASYFLGYEDTDICVRAANEGWKIRYVNRAVAIHEGSKVIGHLWYYYAFRNRIWFTRTHARDYVVFLVWLQHLFTIPRVLLADAVKRRGFRRTWLLILATIDSVHSKPSRAYGPLRDEPRAALSPRAALRRDAFRS